LELLRTDLLELLGGASSVLYTELGVIPDRLDWNGLGDISRTTTIPYHLQFCRALPVSTRTWDTGTLPQHSLAIADEDVKPTYGIIFSPNPSATA
jgi:hypothetical protein